MKVQNYINGNWCDAVTGKIFAVENPFNKETIAHVPDSDEQDVHNAVIAANNAFEEWRFITASERRDLMRTMASKSRNNSEELARTITSEMGKPFSEALDEIENVADYLEYYSELARDQVGRIAAPVDKHTMSLIRYEPYGVVGCIIPWNYPLALMGWKLSPALAAGNTMVMKPSEITPLSILHWVELCGSDLPPGVINVITGYGKSAGEPLVKNPDVPVITFTGSIDTGKRIANLASKNLKKVSLELGGKDPIIICDDADIEVAAKGSSWGGFTNAGQVCTSIERVYVFENIADQWSIENSSIYQGYFHILGGTLSNSNSQRKEDLLLDSLIERVKKNNIDEVILATSATVEGQTTAYYIEDSLKKIDVKVSSIGDANSLTGGTLLVTPLKGGDGKIYAVASGSLSTGGLKAGKKFPTTALIPNGAIIEKEVELDFDKKKAIRLSLKNPDFTTSARIQKVLNRKFYMTYNLICRVFYWFCF